MRNLFLILGGGLLVYIYMCNSKKHKCNCQGDLLNDLTGRANKELEKAEESIKDEISNMTTKPTIVSSGNKDLSSFEQENMSDLSSMDRGNIMRGFNRNRDFSCLYKRYNTSKSATVSPDRVQVIFADDI